MATHSKPQVLEGDVRMRSYLIWEAEGRPSGRDIEHWLRAEAELEKDARERDQGTRPAVAPKPRASGRRSDRSKATTAKP